MDPQLKTEFHVRDDIVLRTFGADDAESVFDTVHRNLGHLRSFMEWAVPDYSIDSARRFIENSVASAEARKSLGFGIFQGGRFIGSVGFVKLNWTARKTEIGYWIDEAEEGKGIVSSACRTLIDYAFGELAMNRVEIRCSTENRRSAAIPERFGFKKEGLLRQSESRNGRLQDFFIYGLLAHEWTASRLND